MFPMILRRDEMERCILQFRRFANQRKREGGREREKEIVGKVEKTLELGCYSASLFLFFLSFFLLLFLLSFNPASSSPSLFLLHDR